MSKLFLMMLLILQIFVIEGCGKKKKKKDHRPGTPPPAELPPPRDNDEEEEEDQDSDDVPQFNSARLQAQMEEILMLYCVSCHNSAVTEGDLDLTARQILSTRSEDIADAILSGEMPMEQEMKKSHIEIVKEWKDAGYPYDEIKLVYEVSNEEPMPPLDEEPKVEEDKCEDKGKHDHDKKFCFFGKCRH